MNKQLALKSHAQLSQSIRPLLIDVLVTLNPTHLQDVIKDLFHY